LPLPKPHFPSSNQLSANAQELGRHAQESNETPCPGFLGGREGAHRDGENHLNHDLPNREQEAIAHSDNRQWMWWVGKYLEVVAVTEGALQVIRGYQEGTI
jgi:hypothetical protein